MQGTPRVYLRLDLPYGDGTRTVTVVAHDAVEFFEPGERPAPLVEDRLLELMAVACRKLGMHVAPEAVVVERIEDDEVWCDVTVTAREPIAVTTGSQDPLSR
jgi:hypothetical protein